MDSVTQFLFGAAVGQAGFRRVLGRRATVVGGLLGIVPDLDVVAGALGEPSIVDGWLHHRGITHSLPAALVYGAALGWVIWRIEKTRRRPADAAEDGERRGAWLWLGALACATHPLIDLFTAYGTQLLAPFSQVRFAIDAMPIIDPLYSLPLLVALIIGLSARVAVRRARLAAQLSLVWVLLYTVMAWGAGLHMERRALDQLAAAGHPVASVSAYPTLFQPWWRRIVADLPGDQVLVGFASPFDPRPIAWQGFPRVAGAMPASQPALTVVQTSFEARVFHWFAMSRLHWTLKPDPAADNPGGLLAEARDYRYGLPGGSELGFWGLRFRLDADHRILAQPERLSERPGFTAEAFARLWAGIWGH